MVIYLDGASFPAMEQYRDQVQGFTSNPSLMKSSGVDDYEKFAKLFLSAAQGKPVSFEVLADESQEIYAQARKIASWGDNVYVKVPVLKINEWDGIAVNDNYGVINLLSNEGIKLNVTAVMTLAQIRAVARSLNPEVPAIISIFAGRIADTGRDPIPFFTEAARVKHDKTKILWASPREVYNYYQAQQVADIITMPPDLIKKLSLKDKDLTQYSRETVEQFYNDGKGLSL